MNENRVDDLRPAALEILKCHAYPTETVEYLGAGAQSVCYGVGDVALLIGQGEEMGDVRPLNPYPLQQWMTAQAVGVGVKTPQIRAVGDRPYPYALMQRAPGISATTGPEASEAQRADWFRQMGAEVRKINTLPVEGFGEMLPSGNGGYCGKYATWSAYLDACTARYLFFGPLSRADRSVRDLFLAQGIISGSELEKIAIQLDGAKAWGTDSVLTHYDNRLANLIVNGQEVTLVDWGLAYAGIGLPQELIKVTEAPPATPEHSPMSAFLEGYGLAQEETPQAIERGMLMLVLDGLIMSNSWARSGDPSYLDGIRAWLRSIKEICDGW